MLTVKQWIEKASWTTPDITAPTGGGLLNAQQVKEFFRVAIEAAPLLKQVRSEFIGSPKAEVPRIAFGSRILRPGTEGARLGDSDRIKPTSGLVTLSTVLFKGEVPVSDELFEDNVEGDAVADTIMAMVAAAIGRDLEEIALKSDLARTGTDTGYTATFDQFDGVIKQLQSGLPGGQKLDATATTTATALFGNMLTALAPRYRQNYAGLRFYVPFTVMDIYQGEVAGRGTPLGDAYITNNTASQLAFRGIPVVPVPMLSGTDEINAGAVNYSQMAILIDPQNIIAGYHRRVRVERYRDPREGLTSFLPTVRFDVKVANPDQGVFAYNFSP